MTGAANHRGSSRQDYATPWAFIRAVEAVYGPMEYDLAASATNKKAPLFISEEQDSFTVNWRALPQERLWLNPPFGNIAPWARKCATDRRLAQRIFFLVPASVDSNWFADYVWGEALVLPIRPRLCFDGKNAFPKPLMLCVYCNTPGFKLWRWRDTKQTSLFEEVR